jgi:hypothetical protein
MMSGKLGLISATLFSVALFLLFHALLAVTMVGYFIFLSPWVWFRRLMDERKLSPPGSAGLGPRRIQTRYIAPIG